MVVESKAEAFDKRLTVRFDGEVAEQLAELKRENYYDRSWAELIRYVITKGLEKIKEG